MTKRGKLLASVAGLAALGFAATTASADQLLSGSITSASGQKLEGVQVSAKREGSTITTNVYTDQNGEYFFPPLPEGKYNVWAQALSFDTAKSAVDLSAGRRRGFQARLDHRSEARYRQLPPEMLVEALPDATAAGCQHQEDLHQ